MIASRSLKTARSRRSLN